MDHIKEQQILCEKYGSLFCEAPLFMKIGISKNVKDGVWPINGMRYPITASTTGWYIWAGEEFSTEADFFVPLHVEHINEWRSIVLKYLGLAPGWRFLITKDYEDVWQDESLINDYLPYI